MHKVKTFSLVQRGGEVRSFNIQHVSGKTLKPILWEQVAQDNLVIADEFGGCKDIGKYLFQHDVVTHIRHEYDRGKIYTHKIEKCFSILKRGLIGTFHHVSRQYVKKYIGEFELRCNNRKITDLERTRVALLGIKGKRLIYKDSSLCP